MMWAMVMAAASASAETHRLKAISAFSPGEQTTYTVSYLGLTAGRARLTVGWEREQFGEQVWPLVCEGETASIAAIWPVKDRFVTYWDPLQRRTIGADFFVDEDKHHRKERYTYDLANRQATVMRQSPGRPMVERRFDIEPNTVDLAAAGFSLRNLKLVPGAVFELPIFTGVKTYKMQATVVGKELLTSALGQFEVFRVTVNGDFSGKLETQGLLTVFYTADEKQLPIRAEGRFLFGMVRIEAVEYLAGRTSPEAISP